MYRLLIAVSLLVWASQGAAADATLSQQQEAARREQAGLQERIRSLQEQIVRRDQQRQTADEALRESESAISRTSRRLVDLDAQRQAVEETLSRLEAQHTMETAELQQRRDELAAQLRGQYLGNLSPWTALLSGDDPHDIGRNMAWLGYISRSQAQAVERVQETLQRLQETRQESEVQQGKLKELAHETRQEHKQLEAQRAQRQTALAGIEDALREARQQADTLAEDDKRLENLISELGVAIEKQAEQERIERERAEQERLAREQAEQEKARQAREQVEQVRKSEQARRQAEAQAEQQKTESTRQPSAPATPLPGATAQRPDKKLLRPASGPVQGRFGAERPEGGVWRGIVIRAPEGSQVRAVAPGRVAYVDWLSGFGNIMIVDHGEQTMSVYAYNQGLLKEVGDRVEAGDAIATVGSTGGQVEPGLYFELRQAGKPVNPELWLAD
ncbi:MAG TPA: peptidoglycan DD-metalloendopeptidase family protein [Burkholderiaceae bacterium]|nr:peptidoglycan DD-metalloendopeptidase family protein [Burkholderiaceae bacterium]